LATRVGKALRIDMEQQKSYNVYNQEFSGSASGFDRDEIINSIFMMALDNIEAKYKKPAPSTAPPPVAPIK